MTPCEDCADATCQACVIDMHDERVERETIARVVAWLRERADERHGSAGQLWSADIANRLERGDWRDEPRAGSFVGRRRSWSAATGEASRRRERDG